MAPWFKIMHFKLCVNINSRYKTNALLQLVALYKSTYCAEVCCCGSFLLWIKYRYFFVYQLIIKFYFYISIFLLNDIPLIMFSPIFYILYIFSEYLNIHNFILFCKKIYIFFFCIIIDPYHLSYFNYYKNKNEW